MQEYDIGKLIDVLLKKIWTIVLTVVIFAAGSFVYSKYFITPKYASNILVYVYNTEGIQSSQDITTAQKLVNSYIIVLKSDTVMESVADAVNLGYTGGQIKGMVSASAVNGTEIFRVTVTCNNPNHAAEIANAIADTAPDEILRNVHAGSVEIIDRAKVSSKSTSPNIPTNILVGALIGLVCAVAFVFIVDMLDTTVKDEGTLVEKYNIPIIGIIPEIILDDKEDKSEYGEHHHHHSTELTAADTEKTENIKTETEGGNTDGTK